MNKHYDAVHRYDFLTEELLKHEYIIHGLTDQQIADKYDMPSKVVVWRKRQKYGIENRFKGKSNKNACKNREFHISLPEATILLKQNKTFKEIANYMGCSILVAKRRFKELGLCNRQEHDEKYKYWDVEPTYLQKQLLIGTLLGDGHITASNAYAASHSIKQKDYLYHKLEILTTLCNKKVQENSVTVTHQGQPKTNTTLHCTSGTNRYIAELKTIFYKNNRKLFPGEFLLNNLEIEGLAYWYMDDGNFHKKSSRIFTNCFFCLEQCVIKDFLLRKFGIQAKINYNKKHKDYHISFSVKETKKLFSLIRPHTIPSMLYKVDYDAYLEWRKNKQE